MTHPPGQDDEISPAEPPDDRKQSMFAWVSCAVALSVAGIALLIIAFGALSGYGWWPWNNDPVKHGRPELYEVTRSAVATGALVAAAVAGAITVRRQRSTERSVRISADAQRVAAEAQQISAHAYELQVEAQKINWRTYELETVRQDAEVVSRLRDRYTATASQLGHESPAIRLAGAYALAALADEWLARYAGGHVTARAEAQTSIDLLCAYMRTPRDTPTDTVAAADLEVRQSIIRIITAHLQKDAHTSWSHMDLDFTGAVFAGDFSFSKAVFSGNTSFKGATFPNGKVSFSEAAFSGNTSFEGANFSGGWVPFDHAAFSGVASFEGATFSNGLITFLMVKFSDSKVTFGQTTFSGGLVSFAEAKFLEGSEVSFWIKSSDGNVSFVNAQLLGGKVSGNWPGGAELPDGWPVCAPGADAS